MRKKMFLLVIPLLGALSVLNSAPSGKTHTVLIKGFEFVPERLEVEAGDTVMWKNQDIVPHTATAGNVFDSRQIDAGGSWSYTVGRKGNIPYICAFHPTMKAELIMKHNQQPGRN
jgi:plastocyanin